MIRKPLYEALPYLYILAGLSAVMTLDSVVTYLSGAMLYAAGCAVWVLRSSYRRKNSKDVIRNRKDHVIFPQWVYEYLPFVYIWLGVAVLGLIESPVRYLPGGLLCLAGALVWIIRAIYRSQDRVAGPENSTG